MTTVNFIPLARRIARTRRRHMKAWAVAATVAAAILAVPTVRQGMQRAEAAHLRTHYDQELAQLQALKIEVRAASDQATNARIRLERAANLRAKRNWSGMVALIAKCLPEGCWLTSLRTDPAAPGAAAASRRRTPLGNDKESDASKTVTIDAPRKLRIAGYAAAAAEPHAFVAELKNAGVFARVELEHVMREAVLDGSYFRFQLVCEW